MQSAFCSPAGRSWLRPVRTMSPDWGRWSYVKYGLISTCTTPIAVKSFLDQVVLFVVQGGAAEACDSERAVDRVSPCASTVLPSRVRLSITRSGTSPWARSSGRSFPVPAVGAPGIAVVHPASGCFDQLSLADSLRAQTGPGIIGESGSALDLHHGANLSRRRAGQPPRSTEQMLLTMRSGSLVRGVTLRVPRRANRGPASKPGPSPVSLANHRPRTKSTGFAPHDHLQACCKPGEGAPPGYSPASNKTSISVRDIWAQYADHLRG